MYSFTSRMVSSPKWKTLAANTASASPSMMPSAKCSSLPTPPEAMTGMFTARETARVNARSKPSLLPSRSMLVRRISPAPRRAASAAHSTASRPVFLRPPCTYTSHLLGLPGTRLASMAHRIACVPNAAAAFVISEGSAIAAEFTETLSAPAAIMVRMSSTLRNPPPTQ